MKFRFNYTFASNANLISADLQQPRPRSLTYKEISMKPRRLGIIGCFIIAAGLTMCLSFSWTEIPTDYGRVAVLSPHFTQASAVVEIVLCCEYCSDPHNAGCSNTILSLGCVIYDSDGNGSFDKCYTTSITETCW